MPIEFHRDGPWELPEGWVWARLGDTCQINRPPSFDGLPDSFEIPFVPMAAVAEETGVVDFSQRKRVSELRSGYTRFRSGDVLFAKITPCMENGKSAALIDLPGGLGAGSTEFHTLRSEALEPQYLWYWLLRKAFRADAQRNMRGAVGQLRVPLDYVSDAQIAIPPLAEQRRIVARIDELFTEITDGEAALARARADLDTWRRALLKAAVTGELTREWRERNATHQTASDFLKRIRERRVSSKFPETFDLDHSMLPTLPSTWAWTTVPELCTSDQRNGISIKGAPHPPGVKALRLDALTINGLDPSACRYIPLGKSRISSFRINPHDFLISRANGSLEFVGRGVYVSAVDEEFVFPDTIIRYPLFQSAMLGQWVELAWSSAYCRRQILGKAKTSAGILKISQDDIAQIAIPLPPESEIAEAVNTLATEAEFAEAGDYLNDSGRDADRLRQSILKAAFEGRLVVQDPRDESAERLLARLSGQETANGRAQRGSKKHRPFRRKTESVIAGLDPAIHAAAPPVQLTGREPKRRVRMDARVKPAHDE